MLRSAFIFSSSSSTKRISRASKTFKLSLRCHFPAALVVTPSSSSQRTFVRTASQPTPNSNSSLVLYNSLSQSYRSIDIAVKDTDDATDDAADDAADITHREHVVKESSKGYVWYTCGPTVYDDAHLGHARTYVCLDILQRALLHSHALFHQRPKPIFIMNITNVDDKILNRAKERNVHPIALAQKYEAEFWEDMDSLNVMRPTIVTRVTDHVEDSIIPYIETIMAGGMAYERKGSVYFDVKAFEAGQEEGQGRVNQYGKLAPHVQTTAAFHKQASEGDGDDAEAEAESDLKRDSRDFVLWKGRDGNSSKEEPLIWNSPWGPGRPGWHIECSAMIESTMQKFQKTHQMYFHAGGVDLKFPHHTNEIAQAEAYHSSLRASNNNSDKQTCCEERGREWIPHWIHTGHLHIEGRKMSKSLKNFITIRELLAQNDVVPNSDGTTTHSSILESPADDFRTWCLGL